MHCFTCHVAICYSNRNIKHTYLVMFLAISLCTCHACLKSLRFMAPIPARGGGHVIPYTADTCTHTPLYTQGGGHGKRDLLYSQSESRGSGCRLNLYRMWKCADISGWKSQFSSSWQALGDTVTARRLNISPGWPAYMFGNTTASEGRWWWWKTFIELVAERWLG